MGWLKGREVGAGPGRGYYWMRKGSEGARRWWCGVVAEPEGGAREEMESAEVVRNRTSAEGRRLREREMVCERLHYF